MAVYSLAGCYFLSFKFVERKVICLNLTSESYIGPKPATLSLLRKSLFELNQMIRVLEKRLNYDSNLNDDDIFNIIHSLQNATDEIWLPLNRIS